MKRMDFYLIRAISNLHVGSGEGDFSVVDKQVQRDAKTEIPIIHASGIKGALREAMTYHADNDRIQLQKVESIFGGNPADRSKIRQGRYNFFEGQLIGLPARSSHDFFYIATCPMILESLKNSFALFGAAHKKKQQLEQLIKQASSGEFYFGKNQQEKIQLEDSWSLEYNGFDIDDSLAELFGDRIAVLGNDHFKRLVKELPIIARNYLKNGVSSNLWYEEYVPREARFITMVSREENEDYLNDFLTAQDHLVQIGANATVGYGLCSFKMIS